MTHVHTIGRVAHQPAGFDSLASGIARGNPITRRERRKLDAPARKERVASDVQGFGAVAHESGEGRLDLAPSANLEDLNLQSDCRAASGRSRSVLSVAGTFAGLASTAIRTALGTSSCRSPSRLAVTSLGEIVDAGGVAARPGKAGDKTKLDRVFSDAEDNRDRRGRSFGCLCSKVAGRRGDNGDAPAHEISHERWQTIELALQPMVLHRHILALDVAGVVEALAKRGGKGRIE